MKLNNLLFYEISTNKMIPVDLPGELGKQELIGFIEQFKRYNPASTTNTGKSKQVHPLHLLQSLR